MNSTARLILIVLLILLLLGMLPAWPYSMGWGFYPSGGLGLVILVVLILVLVGEALNLLQSAIKPGITLTLNGDLTIPKLLKIPAGALVTIGGNAHVHFNGTGAKVGMGSLFCFQVGPGASLNINPGLYFDLNPKQGVVQTFDDRNKKQIAGGAIVNATGVWQKSGALFWCMGMQQVKGTGCWGDQPPDKYYAITATNPNGTMILDFTGLNKTLRGGKSESLIRFMQLQRGEIHGLTARGKVKQTVQLRSGGTMLLDRCDIDRVADGWLEDPNLKDVDPLDRVDFNACKIGSIDWGAGMSGKVYRDGKRIK